MNILFENQYDLSPNVTTEYVGLFLRPVRTLCCFASGFFVYFNTVFILGGVITHNPSVDILSFNALFLIIILFSGIFTLVPNLVVRFSKKQPTGRMVFRFGSNIELKDQNGRNTWEYERIFKIHFLKRSTALMLDDNHGILLLNNGFTQGTYEEFRDFISKKAPHAIKVRSPHHKAINYLLSVAFFLIPIILYIALTV